MNLIAERRVFRRQLGHVARAAQRQVQFRCTGLGMVSLGHQAQPAQQGQQAAAVLFLQAAGPDQVRLLQLAALQQCTDDALVGTRSG